MIQLLKSSKRLGLTQLLQRLLLKRRLRNLLRQQQMRRPPLKQPLKNWQKPQPPQLLQRLSWPLLKKRLNNFGRNLLLLLTLKLPRKLLWRLPLQKQLKNWLKLRLM